MNCLCPLQTKQDDTELQNALLCCSKSRGSTFCSEVTYVEFLSFYKQRNLIELLVHLKKAFGDGDKIVQELLQVCLIKKEICNWRDVCQKASKRSLKLTCLNLMQNIKASGKLVEIRAIALFKLSDDYQVILCNHLRKTDVQNKVEL